MFNGKCPYYMFFFFVKDYWLNLFPVNCPQELNWAEMEIKNEFHHLYYVRKSDSMAMDYKIMQHLKKKTFSTTKNDSLTQIQ